MKLESGMDDLTDEQQYRAHLRALREGLLHTTIVIERAARAYVQTRAILDQINQIIGRPELPRTGDGDQRQSRTLAPQVGC
jgi:hypothetical protein